MLSIHDFALPSLPYPDPRRHASLGYFRLLFSCQLHLVAIQFFSAAIITVPFLLFCILIHCRTHTQHPLGLPHAPFHKTSTTTTKNKQGKMERFSGRVSLILFFFRFSRFSVASFRTLNNSNFSVFLSFWVE